MVKAGETLRKAVQSFALKNLAILATFLLTLLLTRILGSEDAGKYFAMQSMVVIGAAISRVGFDQLVVREVAKSNISSNFGGNVVLSGFTIVCVLFSSIIVALVLHGVSIRYFDSYGDVALYMIPAVVPYALYSLASFYFQGKRNMVLAYVGQGLGLPVVSLALILAYMSNSGVNVVEVSKIFLLSSIIIMIFLFYLWLKDLGFGAVRFVNIWRDIGKSSLSMWGVTVLLVGQQWLPNLILGMLSTPGEVSYLVVGLRLAMFSSIALLAINSIVAPKIAAAYADGQIGKIQRMVILSSRAATLFSCFVFLCYVFCGKYILGFFGEDFPSAFPVLIVLALAQFVNSFTGSVGALFNMSGNEREVLKATSISVFIMLIGQLVLSNKYGAYGAACSYFIGMLIQMLYLVSIGKRRFGFLPIAISRCG